MIRNLLIILLVLFLGFALWQFGYFSDLARFAPSQQAAVVSATPASPFVFSFNSNGTLNEAGAMKESTSPYFWLNSGGQLLIKDGIGMTLHDDLLAVHKWRLAYAASSLLDTDEGYHPQNLFRLITKSEWENVRVESLFRIDKDNLSLSENRNQSNGLLLMSRYKDSDNLYYAGIRVDGHAVIKKKTGGTYYTMAEKAVFTGDYDPASAPNLLPHQEWLALRSETVTNGSTVTVRLFYRRASENRWTELLSAEDSGQYGGSPIVGKGYVGIRTDFMDVSFDSFRAQTL